MSTGLLAGSPLPTIVNFVPTGPDAGVTVRSFMFADGVDGGAIGPGRRATPANAGDATGCASAWASDGSRSAPTAAATITTGDIGKRFLLIVLSFVSSGCR